jgi:spore maturation protein CgeB
VANVHYAKMTDDPLSDVRRWLQDPKGRSEIANAGREMVLSRYTYRHQVAELCRIIEETLV